MHKEDSLLGPDEDRLRYVRALCNARPVLAITMAAAAMIGLILNLMSPPHDLMAHLPRAATHPNTALCLFGLAIALFWSGKPNRPAGIVRGLCLAVSSFALMHHILASIGVDPAKTWLPVGGKMSADTASAIVFMALATAFSSHLRRPALVALAGLLLLMLNGIAGRSFGVTYFGGQMGPWTLMALGFGTVATVSLYVDHASVRVVLLATEVGKRTRVMFGVGLLIPWAAGLFLYRIWGMSDDTFQIEAVMISLIMASTSVLAIASGYQHQRADELRRAAERRLAKIAVTDGLTGLCNRAGLTQVLRRRVLELHLTGKPAGVVMFDLDHFKAINDNHGHDEGDRVLTRVARALEPLLRQGDVFGRWGGEEFLIVVDVRQKEELFRLVERLRVAIENLSLQTGVHCKTGSFNISASFGVSAIEQDDDTYNEAVKRADLALYDAKEGGRNRIAFDATWDACAA